MSSSIETVPTRLLFVRRVQVDAIVRRISVESGFEQRVWQLPVILVPLGTADAPDSVVLRPIHSVNGMTAQWVEPPGTIEWE